jgi:hypothetical protein
MQKISLFQHDYYFLEPLEGDGPSPYPNEMFFIEMLGSDLKAGLTQNISLYLALPHMDNTIFIQTNPKRQL